MVRREANLGLKDCQVVIIYTSVLSLQREPLGSGRSVALVSYKRGAGSKTLIHIAFNHIP